ncbi:hypothetical protein [Sphingomonas sp. G-3-2-10]|uniref:hypothetical protein n=1 Tax=Sphingomonas sp. G-3-2-10 TaxID=2728838 RepID=UPI00146A41E1|nr:hypothetical protein [Sphingomonas sp. G-3-2-10]NML08157.1 hypothetical protein [Sphingomonas sp. G-3-2-10]
MADRSHVTRRAARSIDRDFPARPTLAGSGWCDGIAFVLRDGAPMPDLRPVRDRVRAMWRGTLGPAGDSAGLLVVAFVDPAHVEARIWPSALPLIAGPGATLTSFAANEAGTDPVRSPAAAEIRRIELWWGGQAHRIAIAALTPLPVATLWDMPRIDVHRPPVRVRTTLSGVPVTGIAGSGDGDGDAPRLARVSRAGVPIESDGADLLRDMAAHLGVGDKPIKLSSILRQAFGGLFSLRLFGDSGGHGGAPAQGHGQASAPPRAPGLLANLAGWLRWHTPLGTGLRRQYGERLGQVEKLIASGDLDGALRLALRLGNDNPGKKPVSRYPAQLPEARARLDFDLSNEGISAPIFGGGAYYALRDRYLQLAEKLERDGDFRRAAYIHSQLLGDHRRAVLVLEKGKLFHEAAKLAIDSKQEPSLAIRMFFLAGETDTALALAKRTACFDQLAEESRRGDPAFHAYVIKAWTDMLLATGQPLRALQVTDPLAGAADSDHALLETRRSWLRAALAVDGGGGFDCELAVRAVLTARWNGEDLSADGIGAVPFAAVAGTERHAAALGWLQSVMRGEAEDGRRLMLDLLGQFSRLSTPDCVEQAGFWRGPAQPIVEAFARALIAIASASLGSNDLQTLHALLTRAGLTVLAADVGKLGKLHVAAVRPDLEWDVPPVVAIRPAIRCACLLGNGTMLVWRESWLLQLLDRDGAIQWQQNISDVTALIAIGTSPNVIVVQALEDGASLLTRFASHARTFHPIGKVALAAHHDITSESQWLVQIGGEIGALDLVKLCAPAPRIEFLWSCALTDRLRAIAFAQHRNAPSWLTVDLSRGRSGVMEVWTLHANGTLTTKICLPKVEAALSEPVAPADWRWIRNQGFDAMMATSEASTRPSMQVGIWTENQETLARTFVERRAHARIAGFDTVQSCDLDRPYIAPAADGAGTRIGDALSGQPLIILNHDEDVQLACLARQAGEAGLVLMADAQGRLFVVGARDRRVTIL